MRSIMGRPVTVPSNRVTQHERARLFSVGERLTSEEYARPQTRGECKEGEHAARPCPFVSCKYHLYLDVENHSGSIRVNHPRREPWELRESCALDVAEREGGVTLQDIGESMNVTRERIRQIESRALVKLRKSKHTNDLR